MVYFVITSYSIHYTKLYETGSIATEKELQHIADVMLDNPNIWILTDDIYEHLIYDDHVYKTIAQVEPRLYERTLTVNGVSKARNNFV